MLITGYYKLTFKDFHWAFLGFIIMTIPALVVNAIWGTDWMYLNDGSTTYLDFVVSISDATGWFFTVIVYFFYAFLQALWSGIIVGFTALINFVKTKIFKKA